MRPVVIVLSLHDAAERRAPLIRALRDHAVRHEIWPAIDGRNGLPSGYEAVVDRAAARETLGRDMANAEFACALSHHFIYREMLDRKLELAVILEDDAIVAAPFFRFLENVRPHADCDLLLLDHMRALVRRIGRLALGDGVRAYRCMSIPWMATGYLVTRSGAQKLVERSLPIAAPADWPVDITKMQSYAVSPRLVGHSDIDTGPSDIRQDRSDLKTGMPRRKRRSFRRFLRWTYWRKTCHKRLGKWVS